MKHQVKVTKVELNDNNSETVTASNPSAWRSGQIEFIEFRSNVGEHRVGQILSVEVE